MTIAILRIVIISTPLSPLKLQPRSLPKDPDTCPRVTISPTVTPFSKYPTNNLPTHSHVQLLSPSPEFYELGAGTGPGMGMNIS